MTRKKRQRRYAWLIILAAATACAAPAVPKAEFKVVLREDFEGEGKDFAPEWDLAGSQFKRDTAVFRNGQASLRIDWGAGQDMVTFWSPGPALEVGKNYRISFWVKANDRIQSDIGAYPLAGGAGLVGGGFVPGIKWRKIVCGGRVSGEYGFVGPGPTHFWWRIRGKQKKVTLWIDDFKVEEGPMFAEQAGWTPVAAGRNLIPNGSLEVDPGRHYLQNHASNDRGPDHDWHFSEDAAFGSRSLKLKPPLQYGTCPPKCIAFMARLGPTLELMDPLAFDSADSEFTMSASVKSILAQPSKVTLVLGPPESIDIPFPPGSITLEMTASAQWTRHQKTFKLPRADDGKYFFYVRGDGALLDGLMLARGKSSKFVARQSIEATLTSAKSWRIYEPGDPLAFTLRAVRTRASAPKGLEMTLVNYRHAPGRVVKWQLDAEPGQVVEREVTLDQLPQGCYRAELRAAGAAAVLSDMTFSIMPEPRLVPYVQSNWGVDTGGMSFNTHNWDFAPMYRRLGFRWARLWSNLCLEGEGGAYVFHNLTPEEGLSAANLWLNNLKKLDFGIYASVHPLRKYQTAGGNPYPPKTEEEYAAYEVHLREMAARFGDRIDHWEVSNEPFWPAVSPENYGRMVRETVRILRETDPGSKIISLAGAANGEKEWIERSFEAGATNGVDGISLHYGGYTGVAGGNDGDAVARYGQWRQWAMQGQRPLEVWDSEEHVDGPSFYPSRAQSTTGLQEINDRPAYPALFCTALKTYLCNSAMGVRTMCFNAEYTMMGSGYERGFWERDGGLTPATVASFLAAQMMQTMQGGGFYRIPGGLFGALVHDKEQSALTVWSANYTGTTQLKRYRDPFDVIDATPRPIEQMTDIRDFFRDVAPVKLKVPDQVAVLDTMTVPVEPKGGEITVDIYPKYLVVPRAREGELLTALGAEQTLEPIPR